MSGIWQFVRYVQLATMCINYEDINFYFFECF